MLEQVPRALTYGDLRAPEWDPLRSDPRFQRLLYDLKPIPIVDRATRLKLVADDKQQNDK
jgi:hypothetical protein